jgi:uncharacterized protein
MQVMSMLKNQKLERNRQMALILSVKVVPSSGKNKFVLDKSGTLKIYLKSHPERGKANQELVSLLAKELDLRGGLVEIISGQTSANKRLKLETNLTLEHVLEKLGIQKQLSFFKKD